MTRANRKLGELKVVEEMRRLLGGVPVGNLEGAEAPDVLVINDAGTLGVEVTELHQRRSAGEVSRRGQESERAGILSRLRTLADASDLPILDVALRFNRSVPIQKYQRDLVVARLMDLVSSNVPCLEGIATIEPGDLPNNPLPWVRDVRVYRSALLTKHHWGHLDSGWVQMSFIDEMQEVITKNLGGQLKTDN